MAAYRSLADACVLPDDIKFKNQSVTGWPMTRAQKDWHYKDTPVDGGVINMPATDAEEQLTNCVTNINSSNARKRALNLSWLGHLAGDVHQPLHAATRVTDPATRKHDGGGNGFKLGPSENSKSLHSYWDGLLTAAFESEEDGYVGIAMYLMSEHPRSSFTYEQIRLPFSDWLKESFKIADDWVYNTTERQIPDTHYWEAAVGTAERRVALAGYRLAYVLSRELN